MKRIVLVAILIVSCAAIARAQLPMLNFGGGGQGGLPLTVCTAGAIDLSLSTGCNIPFFISGIFP